MDPADRDGAGGDGLGAPPELLGRSIRTLAWLGDAEFEREVRVRLARRGDFPTERLDTYKARLVCAEGQATLLRALEIGGVLNDGERGVVRRARNASVRSSPRGPRSKGARSQKNTKEYRAATALEALVAHWAHGGEARRARYEALLVPLLEARIDEVIKRVGARPRRG